jgi:hypothetical protein
VRRTSVLNTISLEYSETALAHYIRRPSIVEQLDWIDLYWPAERRKRGEYPQVRVLFRACGLHWLFALLVLCALCALSWLRRCVWVWVWM